MARQVRGNNYLRQRSYYRRPEHLISVAIGRPESPSVWAWRVIPTPDSPLPAYGRHPATHYLREVRSFSTILFSAPNPLSDPLWPACQPNGNLLLSARNQLGYWISIRGHPHNLRLPRLPARQSEFNQCIRYSWKWWSVYQILSVLYCNIVAR